MKLWKELRINIMTFAGYQILFLMKAVMFKSYGSKIKPRMVIQVEIIHGIFKYTCIFMGPK